MLPRSVSLHHYSILPLRFPQCAFLPTLEPDPLGSSSLYSAQKAGVHSLGSIQSLIPHPDIGHSNSLVVLSFTMNMSYLYSRSCDIRNLLSLFLLLPWFFLTFPHFAILHVLDSLNSFWIWITLQNAWNLGIHITMSVTPYGWRIHFPTYKTHVVSLSWLKYQRIRPAKNVKIPFERNNHLGSK